MGGNPSPTFPMTRFRHPSPRRRLAADGGLFSVIAPVIISILAVITVTTLVISCVTAIYLFLLVNTIADDCT
jgi:hypothetical protein